MFKKFISDPSLLFLLAGNLYCVWYYDKNPGGFATIVWIYWMQSVIIGLFNFLDLYTIKNYNKDDFTMNDKPITEKHKGCMAWFFLSHYGFFHFGYLIFILIDFGIDTIDKNFLLLGVAAFLLESIFGFIKRKQLEREVKINIGHMFFLPYLRILPMHMMIIIPQILGLKPSIVFLLLKMAADIFSYVLYKRIYHKPRIVDTK